MADRQVQPVPSLDFLDDVPPSIDDMYSKELRQTVMDVEETEEEERNAPIPPFGEEVMDQKYVDDVTRGYSETELLKYVESLCGVFSKYEK